MFSKNALVVILAICSACLNLTALEQSQKTIFLWDLHDVVLKKDVPRMTKISFKNFFSARFINRLKRPLIHSFFSLLRANASPEEFIWAAQKYNHPHLIQTIRDLQNAQKINPGMLSIIKDLHKQGHTHHIGSNIGETCFKELIDHQKYPQFKELFSFFDLTNPQVVCFNKHNPEDVIKKPYESFFVTYLKKNNIDLTSTRVVFIDDRLENVITARNLNITGIHFKNPTQLKKDLKKIGITI